MSLPEQALEQLRQAAERLVEGGDVWWLPEGVVSHPGGKDRFCLVVALEFGSGRSNAVRAHSVDRSRTDA